jgi:hypothetical protein
MNDDSDDTMWPPAMWASALQDAGEDAVEQQQQLFQQFLEASTAGATDATPLGQLGRMGMNAAVFKTRVRSSGRISIPDAEREALDIDEGDIVQTVVIPLTSGDSE